MITTRSQDREAELRPLMIAGCHGNQQAYAALLSEVAKLLRGFFRKRMLSVPDDVEDVVQEVLIAIHNQRHTYDAGQPLTAWVFGIARFKLADFYRRRGAQGGDHLDIDDAAEWLATEAQYSTGSDFDRLRDTLGRKYSVTYASSRFKDILQACDRHGVDHRTPMNLTPLMAAASTGNVALVDALLERGADLEASDHLGRNALHWALLEAFRDPKYAQGPFAGLYQRLAPTAIDLKTRHPDLRAVLCANDMIAAGIIFECQRRGIRVPDDLAVMGFAGLPIAEAMVPTLSTVQVPSRDIGYRSGELLLARLGAKPDADTCIDLGYEIVARESA